MCWFGSGQLFVAGFGLVDEHRPAENSACAVKVSDSVSESCTIAPDVVGIVWLHYFISVVIFIIIYCVVALAIV